MTEKKDSQVGLQSVIIMVIALVAFAILGYTVINRTSANQEKIIIRIGHNQSSDHPTHVGMEAFEEYLKKNLMKNMMFSFSLVSYWVRKQTWYS